MFSVIFGPKNIFGVPILNWISYCEFLYKFHWFSPWNGNILGPPEYFHWSKKFFGRIHSPLRGDRLACVTRCRVTIDCWSRPFTYTEKEVVPSFSDRLGTIIEKVYYTVTQTIQKNRPTVLEPWILIVCTYSIINRNWVTIYIFIEQSLGLRYIVNVIRKMCRWQIAGIPKHQPLKVLNLFRKAWRDQKGTQDDPLLVSFFPPSSPSSMFNLLICIILKIIDCCTILRNYSLFFVTKLQRTSHFKFEFFLPSSNFLVIP